MSHRASRRPWTCCSIWGEATQTQPRPCTLRSLSSRPRGAPPSHETRRALRVVPGSAGRSANGLCASRTMTRRYVLHMSFSCAPLISGAPLIRSIDSKETPELAQPGCHRGGDGHAYPCVLRAQPRCAIVITREPLAVRAARGQLHHDAHGQAARVLVGHGALPARTRLSHPPTGRRHG